MFGSALSIFSFVVLVVASIFLSACSTSRYSLSQDVAPTGNFDASKVPDAVPVWEPISPRGNASPYTVNGQQYSVLDSSLGYKEEGVASWYGLKFHGELTSNGEIYNMYSMSAAHKTLPLPTYVRVTNLKNSKKVIVRVNDRGPFHEGRVIDLSYAAAKKLEIVKSGTAQVIVEAINPAKSSDASSKEIHLDNKLAYFVQVAALSNKAKAQEMLVKLEGMKLSVTPFITRSPQGIYRVRVGPISNEVKAQSLVELLSSKGIGSPIAIQRSLAAKGS